VRLTTNFNGTLAHVDYTYTAGTFAAPALTSPAPGSTFAGPSVTFNWSPGTGNTEYELLLGLNGAGSSGLYDSGLTTATSATATNLPTNGATVYAQLSFEAGGIWHYVDYTYIEATGIPATMISPASGATLGTSNVTFTWTAGTFVTKYDLLVGVNGPGSGDLYEMAPTTATAATVLKLPANGAKVYVRLMSNIGGAWQYNDYTYTEQ
jgi:hypothetical protein